MLGLYSVFRTVSVFMNIIEGAIVIYCVLSWFQPRFRAYDMLRQFILPFISPFQRLSMKVRRYFNAPVDFTCLFAIIALHILNNLWWRLYWILLRAL